MSLKTRILNLLNIDSIIDSFSHYVEKKLELLKLELKEDAAHIASRVIVLVVLGLIGFLLVLFLSITGGILLNEALESSWLGFALISLFYLLIFLSILILRKPLGIENRIRDYFLDLFNTKDE